MDKTFNDKRMGSVLVARGVLTQEQVDQVLAEQKRQPRPFGQIAADLFSVDERDLWRAWAVQMADFCQHVDLPCEQRGDDALRVVDAQTAWRYRVLPLRYEDGQLICATSPERLPDALAYMQTHCSESVTFVLADPVQLEHYIMRDYSPSQGSSCSSPHVRQVGR